MREGWNRKPLGDVCEMIKRGIAPKYLDDGGACVVNQKCVRNHQVNFDLSRRHNIQLKKVPSERYIQVGDVLVNSTGTGSLGRVAQIRSEPSEPSTVDTHVTIVRPIPEKFHPEFFGYMMIQIEDEIIDAGEGASGQTELARTSLQNNFHVSYPNNKAEQKRIVAFLDEAFEGIDEAIANTEKNLANARELWEITINSAITGKLTKLWRENNPNSTSANDTLQQLIKKKNLLVEAKEIKKEKDIPEIFKEDIPHLLPSKWEWCRLGSIGNAENYPFVDGPFGSSISTKNDYTPAFH